MQTVTRVFEIDYGHRLMNHEGKCKHAHGHRGKFEVTVSAPALDMIGRVVDFGVLKELLGAWLDEKWDHGFIYQKGDPIGEFLAEHEMKSYELPVPPTAENLSRIFYRVSDELLKEHNEKTRQGIEVVGVRCWETPNCVAAYP